jgi:hypothetical protein
MIKKFLFGVVSCGVLSNFYVQAQTVGYDNSGKPVTIDGKIVDQNFSNVITTAVPFLTISPDTRAGGMGDVGAATSPDANSIHWNAAKLAFSDKDMGFSLSVTPWLRKLNINDMSLSYLSGYKKLSKQEAIGVSLLYFNMGNITFTNGSGQTTQEFRPKELAVTVTYSRKLSEKFSIAPSIKYIHSNLSGNALIPGSTGASKAGNTAAVDLGVFYTTKTIVSGMPSKVSLGAVISNFGGKISYSTNDRRDFIPTNLRVGGAFELEVDQYNKFVIAADANKLMVPTPPLRDGNGNVVKGREAPQSMFSGVFGSFTDAPGGFREEMREIMISSGIEYWYNNLFAIRGGYFHENLYKGNRKYFTLGAGLRYQMFGLDFSYLIPMRQNNPLAETFRFTLHFDFNAKARQEDITIED